MERSTMTYKEYWGYYWRVISRHQIPGIFEWDRQLVDLIQKVCELAPHSAVLDFGCGGGDQAKVFAQKGFRVTGIDNIPGLIAFAREAFRKEGLNGEFLEQDMRLIEYESEFDLVTMLSGTFGFFSESGNLELLKRIHWALKPNGRVFGLSTAREMPSHEEWFDAPTSTYRTRHMHILLDGRIIEGADEEGYGATRGN